MSLRTPDGPPMHMELNLADPVISTPCPLIYPTFPGSDVLDVGVLSSHLPRLEPAVLVSDLTSVALEPVYLVVFDLDAITFDTAIKPHSTFLGLSHVRRLGPSQLKYVRVK